MVKKLIGTAALLAVFLGIVTAVASPNTLAAFITTGSQLISDGAVLAIDSNSFVLRTSGGDTQAIILTGRTQITGGSLDVGDRVRVIAVRRNSILEASVIRIEENIGGYGVAGSPVLTMRGQVVSRTSDTLTITTAAGSIMFRITATTRFVGSTFTSLDPGDEVSVTGNDTGAAFVANLVIAQ